MDKAYIKRGSTLVLRRQDDKTYEHSKLLTKLFTKTVQNIVSYEHTDAIAIMFRGDKNMYDAMIHASDTDEIHSISCEHKTRTTSYTIYDIQEYSELTLAVLTLSNDEFIQIYKSAQASCGDMLSCSDMPIHDSTTLLISAIHDSAYHDVGYTEFATDILTEQLILATNSYTDDDITIIIKQLRSFCNRLALDILNLDTTALVYKFRSDDGFLRYQIHTDAYRVDMTQHSITDVLTYIRNNMKNKTRVFVYSESKTHSAEQFKLEQI